MIGGLDKGFYGILVECKIVRKILNSIKVIIIIVTSIIFTNYKFTIDKLYIHFYLDSEINMID